MQKEENTIKKVTVQVTPAQKKLIDLLSTSELPDYYKSVKSLHYLATYCVPEVEILELWQHGYVHKLMDAMHQIVLEK